MKFTTLLIAVLVVMTALFLQEVEARRKILKGRQAVTRNYRKGLAIPSWAIITLVAVGQLIIGGVMYIILKLLILDKPIKHRYVSARMDPIVTP